jgi:hypothetical protein
MIVGDPESADVTPVGFSIPGRAVNQALVPCFSPSAVLDNPARSERRSGGEASAVGRIETTQEELAAFEVIRRLLGPSRSVAYEDQGLPGFRCLARLPAAWAAASTAKDIGARSKAGLVGPRDRLSPAIWRSANQALAGIGSSWSSLSSI